jgi:acyl-CoA hydrolase
VSEESTVEARPARLSVTEMTELVLPQHANVLGAVFGGALMAWVDVCGAITAQRHCRRIAVTAAIDELVFHHPIKVGDVVRLTGRVNGAFKTSMEVEVKVEVEERGTMVRQTCVEALLTFVALSDAGKPARVPSLLPENEEDLRRADEAKARREARLARQRKA